MSERIPPLFIICGDPDADDNCDQMFGVIIAANRVMPPAFSKAGASFWLDQVNPALDEGEKELLSNQIEAAGLRPDLINHDRRVKAAVDKFGVERVYEVFSRSDLPANRVFIQAMLTGSVPVEFDPIYRSLLKVFDEIVKNIL